MSSEIPTRNYRRFDEKRLAFSQPAIGVLYNGERHTLFLIVDDEQLAHVLRGAGDGTWMPFSILADSHHRILT